MKKKLAFNFSCCGCLLLSYDYFLAFIFKNIFHCCVTDEGELWVQFYTQQYQSKLIKRGVLFSSSSSPVFYLDEYINKKLQGEPVTYSKTAVISTVVCEYGINTSQASTWVLRLKSQGCPCISETADVKDFRFSSHWCRVCSMFVIVTQSINIYIMACSYN